MLTCNSISLNFNVDCSNPIMGGVRRTIWIGDKSKLDSYELDINNMMVVILLNYTGMLKKIIGFDGTVEPIFSLIDGFTKSFDHTVKCKNFDLSPIAKEIIEGAKSGKYFVVVENCNKTFEIYGLDAGMKISVITREPNSADTQGAFDITFYTTRNKEPRQPRIIDLGNYVDTLAYLNDFEILGDFQFNNDNYFQLNNNEYFELNN